MAIAQRKGERKRATTRVDRGRGEELLPRRSASNDTRERLASSRAPEEPAPERAVPTGQADAVQQIIEMLVDQIRGNGRHDSNILLDLTMDGVRCLLISPSRPGTRAKLLSRREREIARLVAAGLPNKTIAASLGISVWTVSTHLRRIFRKLEVNSRTAMVSRAIAEGEVEP